MAKQTGQEKLWSHTPPLPITTSPYFSFPINFGAHLKWLYQSWLPITERTIFLCLALISWLYFTPI